MGDDNNKFVVIPYIETISELVASAIKKFDVNVGYRCIKKLNRFVKVHKAKNKHFNHSNVIYKINCKNCDASYIGQTKRQIRTRFKEHVNNIKLDFARHSVISEHILNNQHTFD